MADATLRMLITSVWQGDGLGKAKKDVDELGQKTKNTSEGVGASLSKLNLLAGGAVLAAGAAVTKLAADSVRAFGSFEKGMAEVFTLMPNSTGAAMDKMSADVRKFSMEVGRLPEEVVPALYQAISAGVPPDNVFDFLKISSNAALGGVTDLETAVDGISSVVNAYGADVLGAAKASDLMFTAVKLGKTDFSQLANSLYNVVPTASALGLEFGNVTAALAAMTAQGTPTSVATTQLRQLLVELSKEGTKTSQIFEQMAGMSFREFIAQGGNLQEALVMMEQAAKQSGVGLNDLFGSVEAGNAALALTGKGAQTFTNNLNEMEAALGATDTAADTMGETTTQRMAEMQATMNEFKLTVGEELTPAIADLVEVFTGLASMALPWLKREMEELGAIARSAAAGMRALAGAGKEVDAVADGVAGVVGDTALTVGEKMAILNKALDASGMRGEMAGYSAEIEKGMGDVVKSVIAGATSYENAIAIMEEAGFDMSRSTSQGWILLTQVWEDVEKEARETAVAVASSFDNFNRATVRPNMTGIDDWESQMAAALRQTGGALDLITEKTGAGGRGFDRYSESAMDAEGSIGRLNSTLGGATVALSAKEQEQEELGRKVEQTTASIAAQEAALVSFITTSTQTFNSSEGLFDNLFAAETDFAGLEWGLASVYEADVQAAQDAEAAVVAANQAIADSYKTTAFEALLAQTGVTESTLALAVEMGMMTQAQADARLEFTTTTMALAELAGTQAFAAETTQNQAEAIQLLVLGYASTAEEAAIMAGQISGPLSDSLTASTELTEGLASMLDRVTGQKTATLDINIHGIDDLENAVGLMNSIPGGNAIVGGVGIEARAGGGSVKQGKPYLVGEQGPELIVPSHAGQVYTAEQTASMMGNNGTSSVNFAFNGDIVVSGASGDPEEIARQVLREIEQRTSSVQKAARLAGVTL